jgi:DNA (cytosine-5)-methyltransferase 1
MNTTEPPGIVLEGFAGPGGWSTGLLMLLRAIRRTLRIVGVEWDTAACKTAKAAGHTRVRADVARFDLTAFAGLVWLLIMSPPCQAWSRSGKRRGILDQEAIFRHAMRVTAAGEWIDYTDAGPLPLGQGDEGGTWHDARSPLVLEVLRWVLAVGPANICLEQVPDVLPFWELIARWLRTLGYSVWTGCLSSERYGVPQTRERAILIASRERAVSAPPATHTAYDSRLADGGKWHGTDGDLFGGGLEPWVSMAEALEWVPASVVNTRGDRQTPGGNEFSADRPSWALTEKTRSWTVRAMGDVRMANGTVRDVDHPAGTITASLDNGNHRWMLHTNRDQRSDGTRQVIDPSARPAPTLTAKSGGQWVYRNGNQANAARRDLEEPAPTVMFAERSNKVEWVHQRPAATVQGDPRIAQPGHRDREGGERQFEGESIRVTVQEAAILQSFPADYPWQGTKSAQFRQVGDAVCPRLAVAVIGTCLGLDWQTVAAEAYGDAELGEAS